MSWDGGGCFSVLLIFMTPVSTHLNSIPENPNICCPWWQCLLTLTCNSLSFNMFVEFCLWTHCLILFCASRVGLTRGKLLFIQQISDNCLLSALDYTKCWEYNGQSRQSLPSGSFQSGQGGLHELSNCTNQCKSTTIQMPRVELLEAVKIMTRRNQPSFRDRRRVPRGSDI